MNDLADTALTAQPEPTACSQLPAIADRSVGFSEYPQILPSFLRGEILCSGVLVMLTELQHPLDLVAGGCL